MSSVPNFSEGDISTGVRREPLLLALGMVAICTVMAVTVLATHDWDPKLALPGLLRTLIMILVAIELWRVTSKDREPA